MCIVRLRFAYKHLGLRPNQLLGNQALACSARRDLSFQKKSEHRGKTLIDKLDHEDCHVEMREEIRAHLVLSHSGYHKGFRIHIITIYGT